MPNFKTLLMLLSALALPFIMVGCGMIPTPEAEPEEPETTTEGELPEWLLSEHRTAQKEEEEPLKPKEREEETGEEEVTEPEPVEEAAEPEPAEEPVAEEETGEDHVVEKETDQPEEAEPEETEPEPEQVSDQRWQRGSYSGEWLDGQPHGEGTFIHPNDVKMTGNWVEGNPDGRFTITNPDGSTETKHFEQGQLADAGDEDEEAWWNPEGGSGGGWF